MSPRVILSGISLSEQSRDLKSSTIKCSDLATSEVHMKHIAIGENHLYSKTYAKGAKFIGHLVIMYVLKDFRAHKLMLANPKKEYVNRIGLTVSKKIGKAHKRNRVKRILREGLRQVENENNLKKGFLIVLVARPSATGAKSTDIRNDLTKAVKALNLIRNEKNS